MHVQVGLIVPAIYALTVAILAQGTSWAVADLQAFCFATFLNARMHVHVGWIEWKGGGQSIVFQKLLIIDLQRIMGHSKCDAATIGAMHAWSHAGLNRGPYGYWPYALTS